MRVNVANFIYQDLQKRFPLNCEKEVDDELIDVLVNKWASKEYLTPDPSIKLHHKQKVFPPQWIS